LKEELGIFNIPGVSKMVKARLKLQFVDSKTAASLEERRKNLSIESGKPAVRKRLKLLSSFHLLRKSTFSDKKHVRQTYDIN